MSVVAPTEGSEVKTSVVSVVICFTSLVGYSSALARKDQREVCSLSREGMLLSRERLPFVGSTVTLSPNRACRFAGTRLSLYFLLEISFVRKCSSMEPMMAVSAENECFSAPGRHDLLPEFLSFRYIFEFPYMVDLERPFCCLAVLTLFSVEPLNDL